jgi:beta-glucosidase
MRIPLIVFFVAGLMTISPGAYGDDRLPYQDSRVPVEQRIADLLGRMTLEEKAAQLQEIPTRGFEIRDGHVTPESVHRVLRCLSYGTLEARFGAPIPEIALANQAGQEYARTKTRLGIPLLPMNETLHGELALGATIFPQTIAEGATWNPDLIYEMASAIAKETSATGVVQALAPMLDLARDPRWGRVEECFGECPYLVSRMVVAYIRGMQGDDARQGIAPDKLACMSKVMAGYCVPRNGLNIASASIGEREMRSIFLVPHEAAVKEGHVWSVMPSYNAVDGVPAHANPWLLTKVLRDEWGFPGYVYSDWGGVVFNVELYHLVSDRREAALLAMKSGVDLEAPEPACYQHLSELVRSGKLPEEVLNRAVARVLRVKFLAGLFDGRRKAVPVEKLAHYVHTPEHVALARRVAEESVILLKNDKGLLPLDKTKLRSIAVIGPNADQVQFGDYSATKDNRAGVTVLQGLREYLADSRITIRYAKGCDLVGLSREGFAEAVEAARQSDVAVVVIGDTSMLIGGGIGGATDEKLGRLATVGEGYDRTELSPPGVQEDLVKAIHATGRPTIVVMVQGCPFSVAWMKQEAPAILSAFYPGEQGGHAIADILFGRVNPSGRLPVSVPSSVGHVPTTYDYLPCDRGYYHVPGSPEKPGRDYVFSSPEPLWPFGFGMSYTTFAYSGLEVASPAISPAGTVKLQFTVTNSGKREGMEVAQVYVRQSVSSVLTPVMRLIRFRKLNLKPGESRRVEFEIPAGELALWNMEMKRVVEPGEFQIMVGVSAADIRLRGRFEVR